MNIDISLEKNTDIFKNEEIVFILYTKLHYKNKLIISDKEIEKKIVAKAYQLRTIDVDDGKVLRYMISIFLKLYNNKYIDEPTTYSKMEWLLREFAEIELSNNKSLHNFLFANIQWSGEFKKELDEFDDSFLYE